MKSCQHLRLRLKISSGVDLDTLIREFEFADMKLPLNLLRYENETRLFARVPEFVPSSMSHAALIGWGFPDNFLVAVPDATCTIYGHFS